MKKLINPTTNGGIPITNEDLLFLANEAFDNLKQILVGVSDFCVLSGCTVDTFNAANKNCTVTPGYVWIDGEVKEFPGYTGVYPFYIKSDITTFEKKDLQDGTRKNVYSLSKATAITAKPITPFILCDPKPTTILKDLITSSVRADLDAEINTRQAQIQQEVDIRSAAVITLNKSITILSDKIDTKVIKRINGTDWIDIDFQSGFRQVATSGFARAQYKRTEDGFVHLRGAVELTNTQGGNLTYLPSGFQTLNEFRTFIWSATGSYKIQFVTIVGSTYASPISIGSAPDRIFFLDNISFYADGPGGVI